MSVIIRTKIRFFEREMTMEKTRCAWANVSELDQQYHDEEWGVPITKDSDWFETLILESMQAGLSWATILKKRETMREAFDYFDYEKIAQYDEVKIERLLQNEGIIRHRGKLTAMVHNATLFMDIQKEFGSFNEFIWTYTGGTPIQNHFTQLSEVPATTELSTRISKDLKKRGFKFLGPTTVYAFMQASGLVNDHVTTCFCYKKDLHGA